MTQTRLEAEPKTVMMENNEEPKTAGSPKTENTDKKEEHTWMEEIEIAGNQLVERVKELVAEGNVRRLIIRTAENRTIMEVPLTAGVAVGGVVTIFAPLLAALGALAALIAHVKVQIVRTEDKM